MEYSEGRLFPDLRITNGRPWNSPWSIVYAPNNKPEAIICYSPTATVVGFGIELRSTLISIYALNEIYIWHCIYIAALVKSRA